MPDLLLLLVVFAIAMLGHLALMIAAHNYFYGCNLPHHMSKVIHLTFAGLIVAAPVLLYVCTGCIDVRPFLMNDDWRWLVGVYVVLCLGMGSVWVPWLTWWRATRREPFVQVGHTSRVVDVAKELGYQPVGTGREGPLPYFPGNEIFTIDLVTRTLRLPRLLAGLDGLKILHLTDLHLCGIPDKDWWRRVVELCAEWQPDLVCVTGDVVETIDYHGWVLPLLGRLTARFGCFAILGNHDQWSEPDQTRRALEQAGFQVLQGRSILLDLDGTPLLLVGNEQPWFGPTPDLSGAPADVFRLGLSHTPDNLPWAKSVGIDLLLAGHVHGGQIRFPVVGSLLVPSRYGRRYDCGLFHEGPTVMFVSRGLAGDHPIRLCCRPEATLLVLRSPEVLP